MQRTHTSGSYHQKVIPTIATVRMRDGAGWLKAGWSHCMRMKAPLAALSVMLLGVAVFSQAFGIFLIPAASIIYLGVVANYCRMLDEGEHVPYGDTRACSRAALCFVAIVAGAVSVLLRMLGDELGLSDLNLVGIVILALIAFVAFCMAPALIVVEDVDALQAVRLSFLASIRNPLPVLAFIALASALLIVGGLPLGAGLIIALPVTACGLFKAQQQIFK